MAGNLETILESTNKLMTLKFLNVSFRNYFLGVEMRLTMNSDKSNDLDESQQSTIEFSTDLNGTTAPVKNLAFYNKQLTPALAQKFFERNTQYVSSKI